MGSLGSLERLEIGFRGAECVAEGAGTGRQRRSDIGEVVSLFEAVRLDGGAGACARGKLERTSCSTSTAGLIGRVLCSSRRGLLKQVGAGGELGGFQLGLSTVEDLEAPDLKVSLGVRRGPS